MYRQLQQPGRAEAGKCQTPRSPAKARNINSNIKSEPAKKPQKCMVLRKTMVDEETEKVVIRYVSYQKLEKDSKSTTSEVFTEASEFLRKQHQKKKPVEPSTISEGTITKNSRIEENNRKKLRLSIPIIYKIRSRFDDALNDEKSSPRKRDQSAAMKNLCDTFIHDASCVLEHGRAITPELFDQLKNINSLSRGILANESELEDLERESKQTGILKI